MRSDDRCCPWPCCLRQRIPFDSQRWLSETWKTWSGDEFANREGNSDLVDVDVRGALLEKRRRRDGSSSLEVLWLLSSAVRQVFLPLLVWMRERHSKLQHPKCSVEKRLSRTNLEEAEKHHTSAKAEEKKLQRPQQSFLCTHFSLGLTHSATGEDSTPTLALCDGNTRHSLGLMVPMKGLVPYAVQGVCVCLQELGCTRMVQKSDGGPAITALVTAASERVGQGHQELLDAVDPTNHSSG